MLLLATLFLAGTALAANGPPCPPDPGRTLAQSRFPQRVEVGVLLNRALLWPAEDQAVVGHVRAVVSVAENGVQVVVTAGGFLGLGTRHVALPLDQVALLGQDLQAPGLKPHQLRALPDYAGGGTELPPAATVCVGLAKPAH